MKKKIKFLLCLARFMNSLFLAHREGHGVGVNWAERKRELH